MSLERDKRTAGGWALLFTSVLAAMIVYGSRRLDHFDAALVGYTFATLFATFGVTYRYAMWLNRPPTRMYWRRGWRIFMKPGLFGAHALEIGRRFLLEFAANRFIFRRGAPARRHALADHVGLHPRGGHHLPAGLGMDSLRDRAGQPRAVPRIRLRPRRSPTSRSSRSLAFIVFHGLVWASFLVIAGVMLAFRRRMIDRGAVAVQQFGYDMLPLLLLFAISVTGLMLTASYTWMKGYAYDFLAILHAVTVILTLLWLPFGKLFHIFQRPAQLGVALLQGRRASRDRRPSAAAARGRLRRR